MVDLSKWAVENIDEAYAEENGLGKGIKPFLFSYVGKK